MRPSVLIDTGAILALLDHEDEWHMECTESVRTLAIPMLTSEAVLTEAFHLAGREGIPMEEVWTFLRRGVVLAPIDNSELPEIHALMTQYADHPMDFADATLVYLARRESVFTILTVDRDFMTYRIDGKRYFEVLPERSPFEEPDV